MGRKGQSQNFYASQASFQQIQAQNQRIMLALISAMATEFNAQFKLLHREISQIKEFIKLKQNQPWQTNGGQSINLQAREESGFQIKHQELFHLENQDDSSLFEGNLDQGIAQIPDNNKQAPTDSLECFLGLAQKAAGSVFGANTFEPVQHEIQRHIKECRNCQRGHSNIRLHPHFEIYLCYLQMEKQDAVTKNRRISSISNKIQDIKAMAQAFRYTQKDSGDQLVEKLCYEVFDHCCRHKYSFDEKNVVQATKLGRSYISCARISSTFCVFFRDMYNITPDLDIPLDAPRQKAAQKARPLPQYLALFKLMYEFPSYRDVASYGILSIYCGFRANTTRKLKQEHFVKEISYKDMDQEAAGKYLFCTIREDKQDKLLQRTIPVSVYEQVEEFVCGEKLSMVAYRTKLKQWLSNIDHPGSPDFQSMLFKEIRSSNQEFFSQVSADIAQRLASTAQYLQHKGTTSALAYNKLVVTPLEQFEKLDSLAEEILSKWKQTNHKTHLNQPPSAKRGRPRLDKPHSAKRGRPRKLAKQTSRLESNEQSAELEIIKQEQQPDVGIDEQEQQSNNGVEALLHKMQTEVIKSLGETRRRDTKIAAKQAKKLKTIKRQLGNEEVARRFQKAKNKQAQAKDEQAQAKTRLQRLAEAHAPVSKATSLLGSNKLAQKKTTSSEAPMDIAAKKASAKKLTPGPLGDQGSASKNFILAKKDKEAKISTVVNKEESKGPNVNDQLKDQFKTFGGMSFKTPDNFLRDTSDGMPLSMSGSFPPVTSVGVPFITTSGKSEHEYEGIITTKPTTRQRSGQIKERAHKPGNFPDTSDGMPLGMSGNFPPVTSVGVPLSTPDGMPLSMFGNFPSVTSVGVPFRTTSGKSEHEYEEIITTKPTTIQRSGQIEKIARKPRGLN